MLSDIRKRLLKGVAFLATSVLIGIVVIQMDLNKSIGSLRVYIVLAVLSYFLFSIVYIFSGIRDAFVISAYAAGLFFVITLPSDVRLWGFIILFTGPALFRFIKRLYTDKKNINELVAIDPTMNKNVAEEIIDTANNVHATVHDYIPGHNHAMLMEAGQILLLYKSSFFHRTYRVFAIDNMLYFCRLHPLEISEMPSMLTFTKDEAIKAVHKPYNFYINLNEVSNVKFERVKSAKRYLINLHTKENTFTFKSNGGTLLEDLLCFFTDYCKLNVTNSVVSTQNDAILPFVTNVIERVKELPETEITQRQRVRRMVKILNIFAVLAIASIFIQENEIVLVVKMLMNIAVPIAGYGLYIKYYPLISLDSNKQGLSNITGAVLVQPLIISLLFLISFENDTQLLVNWLYLSLIVTFVQSSILFIITHKHKIKKSICIGILFSCLISSFGLSSGIIVIINVFFDFRVL